MTYRAPITLFIAALSFVLMGCGTTFVPFTHELRSRHDLSGDDLQQLQYYVSHDVKLKREAHTIGRDIKKGELQLKEGKTIEEIVIEQHTPGVATMVDDGAITISFAEGSELRFSLRTGEPMPLKTTKTGWAEPPDPFPGSSTHEPVSDEMILGNYWLDSDSDSMVNFQGRLWNGIADTFRAHLVIDAESLEEVVETKTVLGGRKISSRYFIKVN